MNCTLRNNNELFDMLQVLRSGREGQSSKPRLDGAVQLSRRMKKEILISKLFLHIGIELVK